MTTKRFDSKTFTAPLKSAASEFLNALHVEEIVWLRMNQDHDVAVLFARCLADVKKDPEDPVSLRCLAKVIVKVKELARPKLT